MSIQWRKKCGTAPMSPSKRFFSRGKPDLRVSVPPRGTSHHITSTLDCPIWGSGIRICISQVTLFHVAEKLRLRGRDRRNLYMILYRDNPWVCGNGSALFSHRCYKERKVPAPQSERYFDTTDNQHAKTMSLPHDHVLASKNKLQRPCAAVAARL